MATWDFALRQLGFPPDLVQEYVTSETIKAIASRLKEQLEHGRVIPIVDMAKKTLPYLDNPRFSPLWIVLLDGLSALRNDEEVTAIYKYVNEKQAEIFNHDILPLPVLQRLWLTNLPSLECAVLTLVKHVVCDQGFNCPTFTRDAIRKSHLAEVSSKEPLIYHTVYCMLKTLTVESGYRSRLVHLIASFCQLVRKMETATVLSDMLKMCYTSACNSHNFEAVLRSSPDSLPSLSAVDALYSLYRKATEEGRLSQAPCDSSSCKNSSSASDFHYSDGSICMETNQLFDEIWGLTIRNKEWILFALKSILSCDHQFVASCLWIVAAHYRVRLFHPKGEVFKTFLSNCVINLRRLMELPCITSELQSVIEAADLEAYIQQESSLCTSLMTKAYAESHYLEAFRGCQSFVNHLMMTFLYLSAGGWTIGHELIRIVTNSQEITDHVACVICHYHVLEVNTKQWTALKTTDYNSFIHSLSLHLEEENKCRAVPDFEQMCSELRKIRE